MKVLSLFDGVSCARVALERIGVTDIEYFASEIDKYAIQIAQKNYPDTIEVGDVKDYPFSWQPLHFDLLIGGSPCQDLSIAKKNREGLKGQRSGLFFEYVRILNEVKPRYFVLENVNSMPKEAKEQISEILGVQPVMINAALVSAQNRKRLFWVGKLVGDKYKQVEIPQPEDRGILLKDILEGEVDEKYYIKESTLINLHRKSYGAKGKILEMDTDKTQTLTSSMGAGGGNGIYVKSLSEEKNNALTATMWKGYGKDGVTTVRVGDIGSNAQAHRVYSEDGKSVALSALGGGQGAKTGLYAIPVALRNRGEGKKPEYNGTDKANSLTTVQTDSMVEKQMKIRKLTPIECERLQGLPDNYTEGVSNTQRYKALGNAFNVDVVAHILSFLFKK